MQYSIEEINSLIPKGIYCHGELGVLCPFWRLTKSISLLGEKIGYCYLLNKDDDDLHDGLLWDQVKECGINNDIEEDNE